MSLSVPRHWLRLAVALPLWALLAPLAAAQPVQLQAPAEEPQQEVEPGTDGLGAETLQEQLNNLRTRPLLLRGATIHTLTNTGTLLAGDVLIQGSRILAVGEDLSGHNRSRNAQIINLFGKIITPGFILPWSRVGLLPEQGRPRDRSETLTAGFSASRVWDGHASDVGEAVAAGFTTAHVVPLNPKKLFSGLSTLVSLHPEKPVVLSNDRFGAVVARLTSSEDLPSVAVRTLEEALKDALRFRTNRFQIDSGGYFDFQLLRPDLEALVRIVDDQNWLAVEAHGSEEIQRLIDLARSRTLRLVIYGGAEVAPLAEELLDQDFAVILNPYAEAHQGLSPQTVLQGAAALYAKGVPLMFGSDRADAPWRVRQAAGTAIAWGLPWEEALKSLTLYPARILGLPDRGQIAPGKLADLTIWSGDPLQLSSRAERVFFAGEQYQPVSRDEQLALRHGLRQGILRDEGSRRSE